MPSEHLTISVLKFDWEAVTEGHTEYVIKLCVNKANGAVKDGDDARKGGAKEAPSPAACGDQGAEDLAHMPSWTVRRRYTDFYDCHYDIEAAGGRNLPWLPPKEPIFQKVFGSAETRKAWQEERKEALRAYCQILLDRPDLQRVNCVQELLALRPAQRLTGRPEQPAKVRLHPALNEEGEYHGGMAVTVQQALTDIWGEDREALLPVSEILLVFWEVDISVQGAGQDRGSGEVAARARLKVDNALDCVRAVVQLTPCRIYAMEACSVSIMGLCSHPVRILAKVPASHGGMRSMSADAIDELSSDEDFDDESHSTDSPRYADGLNVLRWSTRSLAEMRLGRERYRGSAAEEYSAVVSEKNRLLHEKAPYQLIEQDGAKQHTVAVVESAPELQPETAQRLHREFHLIDKDRRKAEKKFRFEEAREASAWVAELTGREEFKTLLASTRKISPLRAALQSGEALCELANALAVCAGAEKVPVPSFVQNPANKFLRMDNVTKFIYACREFFELPEHQLFSTADLAEESGDIWVVVRCLFALGGRIQATYPDFPGPRLGIPDAPKSNRAAKARSRPTASTV